MKKFLAIFLFFSVVNSTTSAYATLQTFVSIPPQKWLVEKIGGELVSTSVLVKGGQDPHTFEPTPQAVASLSDASLWFTVEIAFEKHLVNKIQQIAPKLRIIDTTKNIEKLFMTSDNLEQHHHHEHHDHALHRGYDPHVWLSPENLLIMAATVEEALTKADPENSQEYQKNRKGVEKELDQLHQEISQLLAPYKGASFYVFHPSFGYFAHAYGLEQHAVEVEGKAPSPRQLSQLINKAKAEKVRVIFVQPQFDKLSGQVIASAIGGKVVPMNPLAEDVAANLQTIAKMISNAMSANSSSFLKDKTP